MKKSVILVLLICCMCASMTGCGSEKKPREREGLYVEFLSTGKSDCIVIQMDGLNILCDTAQADDYAHIMARLSELGIDKLDVMILTHFDSDHIGCASAILSTLEVERVYMPDYVENSTEYAALVNAVSNNDVVTVILNSDEIIETEHGNIRINPPISGKYDDDNNNSLITSVDYDSVSMLLTGDALKKRLSDYIETTGLREYDLIKLPHHGDYNKSLLTLFDSANASYGIITADENGETVEEKLTNALAAYNIQTYYTADEDIGFTYDGTKLNPTKP